MINKVFYELVFRDERDDECTTYYDTFEEAMQVVQEYKSKGYAGFKLYKVEEIL